MPDAHFDHEQRAVQSLVRHLGLSLREHQPVEKVPTAEYPTPDFAVHLADGQCLAVEVTRLTEPDVVVRARLRAACYEGLWDACGKAPFPVSISFRLRGRPSLRDTTKVGVAAQRLVERLIANPTVNIVEECLQDLCTVRAKRLSPEQQSFVDDAETEAFFGNRCETVHNAIAGKEDNLPAYRSQYDTIYLLMVTGDEIGQIAVGQWVAAERYAFAFDRAFVLDAQGDRLHELRSGVADAAPCGPA